MLQWIDNLVACGVSLEFQLCHFSANTGIGSIANPNQALLRDHWHSPDDSFITLVTPFQNGLQSHWTLVAGDPGGSRLGNADS